jgi:hypothetical protein
MPFWLKSAAFVGRRWTALWPKLNERRFDLIHLFEASFH